MSKAISISIIAGVFLLIAIIGIFLFFGLQSIQPSQGTAYSQTSFTKDTITYSRLWNNVETGFTNKHFLSPSSDMNSGGDFETGTGNRGMSIFYLEQK